MTSLSRVVYIGTDGGGTDVKGAAVASDGRVLDARVKEPSLFSGDDPQATLEQFFLVGSRVLEESGLEWSNVRGWTVDTPGPATDGLLGSSPNLGPCFHGFDIRRGLEEVITSRTGLSIPVYYLNDGHAAVPYLLQQFPDANGVDILYVAVGTGLGGGLAINSKLYSGKNGFAGHIGHVSLPDECFPYFDHDHSLRVGGRLGSAEAAISLTALAHRLQHRLLLPQYSNHCLQAMTGSWKDKAKLLRDFAADPEDELAREMFMEQAFALGHLWRSCVQMISPDYVFLGGGLADLAEPFKSMFLERAVDVFKANSLADFSEDPPQFLWSPDDDYTAAIGSALYARSMVL
jgi:predicted NBD/HSP70 family sugar kinase